MTPSQELRFLILAAQRTGSRMLASTLKPLGLTAAQAEVLMVLSQFGPMSLNELGSLLVCESGSPSRLVAGLVERGLVERRAAKADGRALELELTEAGTAALRRTGGAHESVGKLIEDTLSQKEITALIRGLRKLVANTSPGDAVRRRQELAKGR